jgi:4'-phosphopantetheinyl transferase
MASTMAPIGETEVNIVCAPDDIRDEHLVAHYASLLTPEERERHDRFRFDHGRRQYLITRALVRWVLSINSGTPPENFVFAPNRWGKPMIAQPEGIGLAFNAAHTPGLVTCAVAWGDAVGVDVEHVADRDRTFEIAQRFFSPAEVDALRSLPPGVRDDCFFDYWTLKEAYVKGRGMGLSLPFDCFTMDLSDRSNPVVTVAPEIDDGCRWQFRLVRLTTGHRLAAAVPRRAATKISDIRWLMAVPFSSPVTSPAEVADRYTDR